MFKPLSSPAPFGDPSALALRGYSEFILPYMFLLVVGMVVVMVAIVVVVVVAVRNMSVVLYQSFLSLFPVIAFIAVVSLCFMALLMVYVKAVVVVVEEVVLLLGKWCWRLVLQPQFLSSSPAFTLLYILFMIPFLFIFPSCIIIGYSVSLLPFYSLLSLLYCFLANSSLCC